MRARPTHRSQKLALTGCTVLVGFIASMVFLSGLAAQGGEDGSIVIYDDSLSNRFANWSWADTDMNARPPGNGSTAIGVDYEPWQGLFLAARAPISLEGGERLRFRVAPGGETLDDRPEELEILIFASDWQVVLSERVAVTDEWTGYELIVPDGPSSLRAVWWQEMGVGGGIYIDDISLVSATPPTTTVPTTQVPTTPPSVTSTSTPADPTTTDAPTTTVSSTTVSSTTVSSTTVPSTTASSTTAPSTTAPTTTVTAPPPTTPGETPEGYAIYETFDGDPAAPSQALLPDTFDFVVTNRTHPKEALGPFPSYPADHADNCAGPNPAVSPLPQHEVVVSHHSNGTNPDPSFFVCKNHMMSSLGDVSGYSVSAFWPRQEFDYSNGGRIEFEVNLDERERQWWEVMIIPADQLKVGAADEVWPIDEVYADDRIVFEFKDNQRRVHTGNGPGRAGRIEDFVEWNTFADRHPGDPANTDRRIRRSNVIELNPAGTRLSWSIETEDGGFDTKTFDLANDLPMDQGLVIFTTHAYTPEKDGNIDAYTFHWDNIGFTGPVVGEYDVYEAPNAITLERNGDRPIGDSATQTIDLPEIPADVRLTGQVHYPLRGQVLLSINGAAPIEVNPYRYTSGDCSAQGWNSFAVDLNPNQLQTGQNSFEWTVGPRPNCPDSPGWDGFSIKSLEIQGRAG